ncbi:MAG: hypothetical protein AB9869_25525 [Verrucomicrobiia bacterium]
MKIRRWRRITCFAGVLLLGAGWIWGTGDWTWFIYVISVLPAVFATRGLLQDFRIAKTEQKWVPLAELLVTWVATVVTLVGAVQTDHKLAKLEEHQQGRVLSEEDAADLRDKISRLPKATVLLMGIQGDRESVRFANSLKPVFLSAGWSVNGVWEDSILGGAGTGILVRHNAAATNSPGPQLVEILNIRKLKARFIKLPDPDLNRFELIVGARPE